MPDLPAEGWEVHGVTALRREIISSRQETGERERERERVLEMSVVNCNDCIVIVSCFIDRLRENFYDSSQYNFYSQEQFVK